MKNSSKANSYCWRTLLACSQCLCLLLVTLFIAPRPVYAAGKSGEAAKSKIKSLAAKYTRAMSEIGKVADMNLSSKTELHNALEILRRNDPDLKYIGYRLTEILMENSAFQSGVEERLRNYLATSATVQDKLKKAGAEPGKQIRVDANEEIHAWLAQLRRNPNVVRDWPGIRQSEQEFKNQVARDKQVLHRVALSLKRGVEGAAKNASLTSGTEHSGMMQSPILAKFTEPGDSLEPVWSIQGLEIVLLVALVAIVIATIGICINDLINPNTATMICGPSEIEVPPVPSQYEQCKAFCDKWRDDCIALAHRVAPAGEVEEREANCWYRYYDDCLWSDCEPLKQ